MFTDETKTTYKSTYQILKEISDIYNDLSDKNQAELLETLAGKRGGQVLAGILEDFSEVERAMNNMSEAAGSADAEMGIVEESIQYKLNNLQQTWVGIIQKLIDNGMLGQLIDALTAISEVLGEIITSVGPIPTILGAIGLTKLIPNLDSVFDVIQRLSGESSNIVDVVSDAPDVIGDVGEAVEEVTGTVETVQGVAEGIPGTIASIQGALTALMANPLTPWIVGITVAVGAVALAIDHSTITVKEATKALKDYGDKYAKTESDLKAHEDAVKNLSDSYFKLAKGVDALTGKNVSLSSDDYEEFVATNQELAEMFPTLIKGVDQYGNYILDLGDDADSSRQKLKELLEQEKENYNYELYKDLPDVFKNTKVLIDDAATSLHNVEDDLAEYNRLLSQLDSASVFNDNPFVLSTKFTNENTAELIRQFELNYQKMIDEVAKENEDLAFRLRDALQDDSDGENYAKYLNFTQFTDEERQLIDSYFDKYVISVTKGYGDSVHELNADLKTYQSQISSAWNGIKKNIIGGIDFLSDDDKVTESLTAFVNSLPSEFAEGLSQVDIQNYIADWVSDFENLDDASKLKFTKLFDSELTPEERIQLYNDLQTNLPDGFDIPIHLVVENDQDLLNRVNVSKARLSHNFEDKAIINNFFEEMSIDTSEEYNLWLEVTKGIDDATEAMGAYRKAKEAAVAVKEDTQFDVAKFNENDSDLESMQTLYNQFRENVEGDKIKVPLDISDVEGLREKWEQAVGKEQFDKFELKVTASTDVSEVQQAFDDIVTEYSRSMIKIEGATKETMEMVKAQLKMDGLEESGVDKLVDSLVAEDKMNKLVGSLEAAQDAEGKLSDGALTAASSMFKEAQQLGITNDMLVDYLGQAIKAGNIKIDGDLSWLQVLAENLQIDIGLLRELLGLANQGSGLVVDKNGSRHSTYGMPEGWGKQQSEWRNNEKYRNVKPLVPPVDKSAAGGAGKETADAYVEGYEKEKEKLERDRDLGLISERTYLDKLKQLIDRFFKDRADYAEKYMDEMKSYMDALLSHYNSVISGVTTLLSRRITSLQNEKDTIITALQEEQKAAEEAYQSEIDGIQEEIDAIQEKIDALDDEIEKIDEKIETLDEENEQIEEQIEGYEEQNKALDKQREGIEELIEGLDKETEALDEIIKKKQKEQKILNDSISAINEANEARDRSINLQKAEYELQRMQNQRTKLVCKYARGYSNVA